MKTAKVSEDKIITIVSCEVNCPYCNHKQYLEDDTNTLPTEWYCDNCEREFKIQYVKPKK